MAPVGDRLLVKFAEHDDLLGGLWTLYTGNFLNLIRMAVRLRKL